MTTQKTRKMSLSPKIIISINTQQSTHLAVVIPFQMQRLNAAAPTARSPDSRVVTV